MTKKPPRPAMKNNGGQGRRLDRTQARVERNERFAKKEGGPSSPSKGPRGPNPNDRVVRAPWEKHKDAPPRTQSARSPMRSPSGPSSASGPVMTSSAKALPPDECVYGRHAVDATLRYMPQRGKQLFHTDHKDVAPLVELAKKIGIPTSLVDLATVDALAGGRDFAVAQGVVLSCDEFPNASVDDFDRAPNLTLVLDGVEDPRNLGAAVRAAYALGAGLVVVPHDRAAAPTASAIKASAGALCRIPLAREVNLRRAIEILKEKGAWIVGAEADGDAAPWELDLTGPTVIVIGGEDRGLRRLTREACDHVTAIPMPAGDMSLNAADAASLLLYEVLRQRKTRTPGVRKAAARPAAAVVAPVAAPVVAVEAAPAKVAKVAKKKAAKKPA